MHKLLGMVSIVALLAACASTAEDDPLVNPNDPDTVITIDVDPVDPTDPTDTPDPIDIVVTGETVTVGGIRAAEYDGSTLRVNIALDGTASIDTYDPDGGVTGTNYDRFTTQNNGLSRFFTALAGESAGGEVFAVVAIDGGQFNRFLGGATVTQTDYDAPENAFVSYAGDYVGLLNVPTPTDPGPTGVSPAFFPRGGTEITGNVIINADFGPGAQVEGGIFNRETTVTINSTPTTLNLGEVVLVQSDILENGLFGGPVEQIRIDGNAPVIGSFSGAFGGSDAAFVGGTINLGKGLVFQPDPDNPDADIQVLLDDPASISALQEYGIFVMGACHANNCAAVVHAAP